MSRLSRGTALDLFDRETLQAGVQARIARSRFCTWGHQDAMDGVIWEFSDNVMRLLNFWEYGGWTFTNVPRKKVLFWSAWWATVGCRTSGSTLGNYFAEMVTEQYTMRTALELETGVCRSLSDNDRDFDRKERDFATGANVLRCIVGNPFYKRLKLKDLPSQEEIKTIARGIYETGDWGAMPILADRMEDEGFDDPHWLKHMRQDSVHTRGCYVLDTLLSKCEWL